MRKFPVPVVGGAYSDDALEWSAQDCLNLIPVGAERGETRTPNKLVSGPGLRSVVQLSGAIRGMRNVEGKLFVVAGNDLVWVRADYSVSYHGSIPGAGRVSMTHNQIANGNELVIANGSAGYVYNTYTEALAQITDSAFIGATVVDYVDSYILGVEPGRRFWFHSELADASSYLTTDRYEAESSPDRIRSLIVSHREVIVLGERTTEVWINTGAQSATFERATGTVIETGCIAAHSVARLDNSVFWLGDDLVVYRLDGYNARRISTRPIERDIARSSKASLANAFAYTFEDRGHKIYYLTLQDGKTWGYDAATGEWHRRASFQLDRWRPNAMVRWENLWIAGDYSNGKIYVVDWDHMLDNGSPLVRQRVTGAQHADMNPFRVQSAELLVSAGPSISTASSLIGISGDAPDTKVGAAYSYSYSAIDATAPLTYAITRGSLPSGLSMSSAGVITGTPDTVESQSFKVRVTDANSKTASLEDSISVASLGVGFLNHFDNLYGGNVFSALGPDLVPNAAASLGGTPKFGHSCGLLGGTTADYQFIATGAQGVQFVDNWRFDLWVKTESNSVGFFKLENAAQNRHVGLSDGQPGGQALYYLIANANGAGAGYTGNLADGVAKDGTYSHVAIQHVRDGGTDYVDFFVDGIRILQSTVLGGDWSTGYGTDEIAVISIGASNPGNSITFDEAYLTLIEAADAWGATYTVPAAPSDPSDADTLP